MTGTFLRSAGLVVVLGAFLAGCSLFSKDPDPNHGVGNGDTCTDSTTQGQSNCMTTLSCVAIDSVNMCSYLSCSSDSDCGSSTAGFANYCINLLPDGTTGCVRGCDPVSSTSCGRTDFVCVHDPSTGHDFCIPDCRAGSASFCSYGKFCDRASDSNAGQCIGKTCTSNADCPSGSNTICAHVDGHPVCVPDCANTPCPSGRTCNSEGGCDLSKAELYGDCSSAGCDTTQGLGCVTLSSGAAVCLQMCSSDANCSAATATQAQGVCTAVSGSGYCVVPCTVSTTCPSGTTCQFPSSSDGTSTSNTSTGYCLP